MNFTAAVISFVYLFAFIRSCYGLKCYSCESTNNSKPKCNTIFGDRYLKDFHKVADVCMSLRLDYIDKSNEPVSIVHRRPFTREGINRIRKEFDEMKTLGINVDLTTCETDGCNAN